jgi:isoquinoline 1-oxidoreductase beta subunit
VESVNVKNGVDVTSVEGVFPTPYAIPAMSGDLHTTTLQVRPLPWRSVGNTHTAFVMETMMDELAAVAGSDPRRVPHCAARQKRPRRQGSEASR